MSEQFSIDVDQLRALAPTFDRVGVEALAAIRRLRTALDVEGAPWGNDDTGHAFAKSYLPEKQRTMSDLETLAEVLRQAGADLRQLATNVENQDHALRQRVAETHQPLLNMTGAQTNSAAPSFQSGATPTGAAPAGVPPGQASAGTSVAGLAPAVAAAPRPAG
ncbi:MAG: hypothetical protein HOQ24_16310, partial [Mycobacteriaceae bacterium]|nr:hypothetical protein [Mycobacteriaceae bacterium]